MASRSRGPRDRVGVTPLDDADEALAPGRRTLTAALGRLIDAPPPDAPGRRALTDRLPVRDDPIADQLPLASRPSIPEHDLEHWKTKFGIDFEQDGAAHGEPAVDTAES